MSDFKILVVEDNKKLSNLIQIYLSELQHTLIYAAFTGEDALKFFKDEHPMLMILDIGLPGKNGYEVLKEIRMTSNIPVIIVSAKGQDTEKILGFNLGADDYIVKPFNPLELIARVKVQIRRFLSVQTDDSHPNLLTAGALKLDTKSCQCFKEGQALSLTYTEFKLLKHFMLHPNRVFTKQQLYSAIWEEADDLFYENTVMVYISKLRDKIGKNSSNQSFIVTVRGLGYKFEA